MSRFWSTALTGLLVVVLLALFLTGGRAEDDAARERREFFKNADKATLICDGKRIEGVACCGQADGAAARAQYGSNIIATITKTLRHPTAKPGDQIIIPKCKIAVWPVVPASMKTDVVFMSKAKSVYCFFPQAGG